LATTQTVDTIVTVFSIYEIFIVACSIRGLPYRFMQRRAAATTLPTSGRELCACPARTVPAAATAVQSEWPCSTHRYTARGDLGSVPASSSRADKGRKRGLSVRNSGSWQASPGRESLFTWQIYRCGRIPSGNGSKRSIHGQNLSCSVMDCLESVRG